MPKGVSLKARADDVVSLIGAIADEPTSSLDPERVGEALKNEPLQQFLSGPLK